jgi:hypothetical protein
LMGRFREAMNERYRDHIRSRKYWSNRVPWPPYPIESDPPDEDDD